MSSPDLDRESRQAIRDRLDANLYVEAGAGTGKTTSLVDRVVEVITKGVATIDQIVAITFTRAAASELRSRIREQLEMVARDDSADDAHRRRISEALEGIDGAAFQTIDSFALSLLRERPMEVGLPPLISPRDELEAEIQFTEEWRRWLDAELSATDGEFKEAVGRAMRLGLSNPLGSLYEVTLEFHAHYDVLATEEFIPPTPKTPETLTSLLSDFGRVESLSARCTDSADGLFLHVETTVKPWVDKLRGNLGDIVETDYLVATCPKLSGGNRGRRENWPGFDGLDPKQEILDLLKAMQASVDGERQAAAGATLCALLGPVRRIVLDYAARRRAVGQLEFHDMLVLARELLAQDAESRSHFRRRYPVVLVDEFQDTDPVQLELLELLTGGSAVHRPGSLFLVGDPKQSIYRFRSADVSVSEAIRDAAEKRRDWLPLQENHRSQKPIIDWVNHVFADWIERQRRENGSLQTHYIPLASGIELIERDASERSAVRRFGAARAATADVIRASEFQDVAAIAASARDGELAVRDQRSGEVRPSTLGDVCVLLRTRTGMDQLEQAMSDAGVPFSLEGQSLLFSTQVFRDLENALLAIDDPTDQVAVMAALRSSVFGCSDEDVWLWASNGGRFDYLSGGPEVAASSAPMVNEAFKALRDLHQMRMSFSFPVVVERLVRGQRLIESAYLGPQHSERVRRIELFMDHARQLSEAGVTSLRSFTTWLQQRREGRARAPEAVLSESGLNAVRVMTMHAAKGLEFPIVVLAGNSSNPGRTQRVVFDGAAERGHRVNVRLGRQELKFETTGFQDMAQREKTADECETARLMYVAATRARDHLFVSLHRRETGKDSTPAAEFEAICSAAPSLWEEFVPVPRDAPDSPPVTGGARFSEGTRREWLDQRSEALARAGLRSHVTATALKPSADVEILSKETSPDSLDEPWRMGRGALAYGRAVHAVLQYARPDGSNVGQLAEEQAVAHDLGSGQAADVANAARKTLELPSVAAAGSRQWRELWLAAPVEVGDGHAFTMEGTIDLIYEAEDGSMVIVDYKTDRVGGSSLEDKAEPYLLQLGAYAWTVESLTGRRVSKAVLVFSSEAAQDRPAEYEIPDLHGTMAAALEAARAAGGR